MIGALFWQEKISTEKKPRQECIIIKSLKAMISFRLKIIIFKTAQFITLTANVLT